MRETRASRALKLWVEELDRRGARKRTQEDVAREISKRLRRKTAINQSTVSSWCAARSKPGVEEAVVLSQVAGIRVSWWLEPAAALSTGTNG